MVCSWLWLVTLAQSTVDHVVTYLYVLNRCHSRLSYREPVCWTSASYSPSVCLYHNERAQQCGTPRHGVDWSQSVWRTWPRAELSLRSALYSPRWPLTSDTRTHQAYKSRCCGICISFIAVYASWYEGAQSYTVRYKPLLCLLPDL